MPSNISIVDIIQNTEGRYKGDLKHYFRVLYKHASNLHNPYHNLRHMLHVMWESYDGAKYHHLDAYDTRNILIAAIFHDFNHSGKMAGNDDLEIEASVRAMKRFLLPEDSGREKGIEDLIRSTQFPYQDTSPELPIRKRILRDADMSQSLSTAWIQQTLIGLPREMGMDAINFLKTQESFLKGIMFQTTWGKRKFKKLITSKVNEVNAYLDFLEEG